MNRAVLGVLAAVLAGACGSGHAQSSAFGPAAERSGVTVFGILDTTIGYGSGSISHLYQLYSGGGLNSRLGFRGFQDLGGGLAAAFWLEAGLNVDDGTGTSGNTNNQPSGATSAGALTFNRRSTVSLIDRWGEIRMGRDFTAYYRNRDNMDPFGNAGVGTSMPQTASIVGPTSSRVSNMVEYLLPPDLGGVFGELQYFMGENATGPATTTSHDGTGYAGRIGWGRGDFAVAAAGGKVSYAPSATTGNVYVFNVGASYDFKLVKLGLGYYHDRAAYDVPDSRMGFVASAVVPVGAHQIKMSYSAYGMHDEPTARKVALGYVYNFSKRTAGFVTGAYVRNSGGSAIGLNGATTGPDQSSRGMDVGMRVSF
jgi:predicted porin